MSTQKMKELGFTAAEKHFLVHYENGKSRRNKSPNLDTAEHK